MSYQGSSGKTYLISEDPHDAIATGGEGSIFSIDATHVAKVYLKQVLSKETDLEAKIRYMISHPPARILKYMSWPTDALYKDGRFVGFVMNKLSGYSQLRDLYSFSIAQSPSVDLRLLVAYNLSNMVNEIHNAGYVIGDFNPKNIGYNDNGTVCFYDNDSFQFKDDKGNLFKCGVNFEGYVAPEVMDETESLKRKLLREGKDASKVQMKDLEVGFTKDTDRFALAVHIFQLMFNGFNPYASIPSSESRTRDSPTVSNASSSRIVPTAEENVKLDNYCFKNGLQPKSAAVPRVDLYPSYITRLFSESFRHLRSNEHRPTAQDWIRAISRYKTDVKQCGKNKEHIIWQSSPICPYCDALDRFSSITRQYTKTLPTRPTPSTIVATSSASGVVATTAQRKPAIGFRFNATANEIQQFNTLYTGRQSYSNISITGSTLNEILRIDQGIVNLLSRYTLDATEQSILNQCKYEISRIKQISQNPAEVLIHLPENDLENKNMKIIVSCPTTGATSEHSFGDVCRIRLPRVDMYGRILDIINCTVSVQYYRRKQEYKYSCDYSFYFNCDYSQLFSSSGPIPATTCLMDVVYCNQVNGVCSGGNIRRWKLVDHSSGNAIVNQNSTRTPLNYDEIKKDNPKLFFAIGIIGLIVFFAFIWHMCNVSENIIWSWKNTWERNPYGEWIYEPYYFGTFGLLSVLVGAILIAIASFISCDDNSVHAIYLGIVGGIGILLWGIISIFWNQFWPILLTAVICVLYLMVVNPFDKIINNKF